MSIWSRIAEALKALASGESLSELFRRTSTPPEKSVAFTIAVISLGAKMAKADGEVTRDEVRAFREIFYIPAALLLALVMFMQRRRGGTLGGNPQAGRPRPAEA